MFYKYKMSEIKEKYGKESNFDNVIWGITVYNKIQFIGSDEFLCEICLEKVFNKD